MKINFIILITFIHYSQTIKVKSKNVTTNKSDDAIKKYLEKHEEVLLEVTKNKSEVKPVTITNVVNAKIVPVAAKKAKAPPKMIPPDM